MLRVVSSPQAGPFLQKDARIFAALADEFDVPRGIAFEEARSALQAMAHPM